MGNGIVDGVLVDPKAYFFSLVGSSEGQPAGDWRATFNRNDVIAGLELYGFGQQRRTPPAPAADANAVDPKGEPSSRLFVPSAICSNAKPRPGMTTVINGQTYTEAQLGVIQTPPCWEGWIDTVDDATQTWTWRPSGQPYVPIPAVDPNPPDPPDPPAGDKPTIGIFAFPTTYRRNELAGLVTTYGTGRPSDGAFVDTIEWWLNDGAPRFSWTLNPPGGSWHPGEKDGPYVTTVGVKADRNGTWNLFMRCRTVDGRWSDEVQGDHSVTVSE